MSPLLSDDITDEHHGGLSGIPRYGVTDSGLASFIHAHLLQRTARRYGAKSPNLADTVELENCLIVTIIIVKKRINKEKKISRGVHYNTRLYYAPNIGND